MKKFKLSKIHKLPKTAGVYSILNVLNGKRYIGSSINIHKRLANHRSKLRTGKHYNQILLRAYNKYGEDKFVVEILEQCEPIKDTLFFLEQKYLDLNPEYNIAKLANRPSRCGHHCSEEQKEFLRKRQLGKKPTDETKRKIAQASTDRGLKEIHMYSLDGDYIRSFVGHKNVYKYFNNTSCTALSGILKGNCKKAFGYMWSDEKHDKIVPYRRHYPKERWVAAVDKNGNTVAMFNTLRDAGKFLGGGDHRYGINKCCSGKSEQYLGYKWINIKQNDL